MWILRKFYAGSTGCLPPTDPRIMAMTPEMIELEFAHIAIDRKLKGGSAEQYEDPDYDDYDKESDAYDSKISDDIVPAYQKTKVKYQQPEDKWEDVEIDES